MLRIVLAVLVSGAFVFSGLTAASAQEKATATPASAASAVNAPLPPGKAAGIKQAQAQRNNLRNFIPFAVVGGLAVLVVVSGNDDDDSTTTTTGSN